MKALTLHRPWPHTIFHLDEAVAKRLENRTWRPPKSILGKRIAIHAGHYYNERDARAIRAMGHSVPAERWSPKGCIVGTVVVTGFCETSTSPWFFGPYGWLLDEVTAFDMPIMCDRGYQGLWTVPEGLIEETPEPGQMELRL